VTDLNEYRIALAICSSLSCSIADSSLCVRHLQLSYLRWRQAALTWLPFFKMRCWKRSTASIQRMSASLLKVKHLHTLVQLILVELSGLTSTSHLSDLGHTIKCGHTTRDITSTDLTGKPTLLVLLFYLFLSFTPRESIQYLVPKIFLLFRMLACLTTPEFPDLRADRVNPESLQA
jgi:hypothetical protein